MVKHERDRSRSPVPNDRKRRAREDSPSDQSRSRHKHRHRDRDNDSPASSSQSSSPDARRHKKHTHSSSPDTDRHKKHTQSLNPDTHRHKKHKHSSSPDTHKHKKHPHRDRDRPRHEERREARRADEDHSRFQPPPRSDSFREQQRDRQRNDDRRREARQQREQQNVDSNFGRPTASEEAESSTQEKEKPNMELSGKLTEDTNTYRGVVIKYNEPAEARKPKRRWRLYGFKGDESLPMLAIHRQSAYLLGRDRRVADIPVDHPSCSKQHAVLQYRLTEFTRPDGSMGRKVRPYIIDLGSANGTYVNNQRIDGQRYVELFERDLIKFGFSSREYVLLHENVDTAEVEQTSDTD